jgi:hypothetical protein
MDHIAVGQSSVAAIGYTGRHVNVDEQIHRDTTEIQTAERICDKL